MTRWTRETPNTYKLDRPIKGWKWCSSHNPPQYRKKSKWSQRTYKNTTDDRCKKCGGKKRIRSKIESSNTKTALRKRIRM
jgi:hypothetical protein